MTRFLSGPPGGRTLPLMPPRLSDLAGGVFGPGASVASTGMNAGRAVVKTANARAAGETWEDSCTHSPPPGPLAWSLTPSRSLRASHLTACTAVAPSQQASTPGAPSNVPRASYDDDEFREDFYPMRSGSLTTTHAPDGPTVVSQRRLERSEFVRTYPLGHVHVHEQLAQVRYGQRLSTRAAQAGS